MDLEVVETRNGGDIIKNPKDLSVIRGLENMSYLGMFGGNIESSTPQTRRPNSQASDYWGNSIFDANDPDRQFNSETERALMTIPLTSFGRVKIEQAVIKDHQFMKAFANVSVDVQIISSTTVLIGIRIRRPDNLEEKIFAYIWDATIAELTMREPLSLSGGGAVIVNQKIFDFSFDPSFE